MALRAQVFSFAQNSLFIRPTGAEEICVKS
jgi:hypothetical protein